MGNLTFAVISHLLTKAFNQDYSLAFLGLRNTPRQDVNISSSEIVFGRQTRSTIPTITLKSPLKNYCPNKQSNRREAV